MADTRRAVHQGHELGPEPVLLQLGDLEVVEVREMAEHQLRDEEDRGEHRVHGRLLSLLCEQAVGEAAQHERGQGRRDVAGEHRRDSPHEPAAVHLKAQGEQVACGADDPR